MVCEEQIAEVQRCVYAGHERLVTPVQAHVAGLRGLL